MAPATQQKACRQSIRAEAMATRLEWEQTGQLRLRFGQAVQDSTTDMPRRPRSEALCRFSRRDRSAFRRGDAKARRHMHEIGERVGSHLAHGFAAVGFDRDFADAELDTDLLVEQSCDD